MVKTASCVVHAGQSCCLFEENMWQGTVCFELQELELQELVLLLSHTLMCLNALQLHAGYIGHAQTHLLLDAAVCINHFAESV